MSGPHVVRLLAQAKYRYQDQSKKAICAAINNYRNLNPAHELYHFPNGVKQELVALTGTIPVNYKGNTYNIPVAIYIPNDYPYSPPICYVKPTADMMIKQGRHVDASGKVYLPYLSDWKNDQSDLLGVIQVMIIVFGESPPVYQKPKNPVVPAPADNCPYPRQQGYPYPIQMQQNSHYQSVAGFPTRPPVVGQQPSYPGYNSGYSVTGAVGGQTPYPVNTPFSTPSATPSYPHPPATATGIPPSTPFSNTNNSISAGSSATITAEHIKASLISAVEDSMRQKINERIAVKNDEIACLKNTQEELERGRKRLEDMIAKMETETVEASEAKKILEEKNVQYQALIVKYKDAKETPDIDEAFGPMEPLYKQLMNAFAEENSISDAIFYLSEGLQKGVLDLETFLKHVRDLSRKQFMLRALMQKCRERAGLPC